MRTKAAAFLWVVLWGACCWGQIDAKPEITNAQYVAWVLGDEPAPANPPADPPKPREPVEPLKIEGDYILQIRKLPVDIVAPEGFTIYVWKPARELLTFEQGNRCTIEKADRAGTYRIQVTYYEQTIVDGKIQTTTHGGYLDVLIGQQPAPPPGPIDPDDPPPPIDPNTKVARIIYVFEKDQKNTPRPVALALQKINSTSDVVATEFEEDSLNGQGVVPKQYEVALKAARESGLPSLVVQDKDFKVLRVIKDPTTEQQVMEALKNAKR